MSKKSRKRNKRLLALAGLAGAVAMSNRKKKSDLASTEDGKSGSTKITGGTNSNDYDGGTKKKPDSKMPDNLSKDMGKNNKTVKKTTIKPFRAFDVSVPEGSRPLKLQDNSIRAKNRGTNAAGIKEPNKPMIASILPRSKTADNYAGDMRDYAKTNYKSGGRAGYKSGGSTGSSKSSGCAIKGISPILMKGRK